MRKNIVTFCILAGAIVIAGERAIAQSSGMLDFLKEKCEAGEMHRCAMMGVELEKSDPKTARAMYKKACDGKAAYGCYRLADVYRQDGNDAEAKKLLEQACNMDPDDKGLEACIELGKI